MAIKAIAKVYKDKVIIEKYEEHKLMHKTIINAPIIKVDYEKGLVKALFPSFQQNTFIEHWFRVDEVRDEP